MCYTYGSQLMWNTSQIHTVEITMLGESTSGRFANYMWNTSQKRNHTLEITVIGE